MDSELLENIIRESVENYIDESIVDRTVEKIIKEKIKDKLDNFSNTYIETKIDEAIDLLLNGEINTDDGWGKKEHYDTFEDMFKVKFNEKLNDTWEMKCIIARTVQERLEKLFKAKTKEVSEKIQGTVLEEMLKEDK